MDRIRISIGDDNFVGRFRTESAPKTCAAFRSLLPWRQKLIHVRWSGEGLWVPLGDFDLNLGFEDATSHPRPGEFIFYPGGVSETELLVAYGPVAFASKAGQLAGNPLLVIEEGLERLAEIGREILWGGAREIVFHAPDA